MAKKKTKEDIAPFPPVSEEGTPPAEAAAKAKEDTKSDAQKEAEAGADARIATGGQGGFSYTPPQSDKTITTDALKKSEQPLAPEHPLEVPDKE